MNGWVLFLMFVVTFVIAVILGGWFWFLPFLVLVIIAMTYGGGNGGMPPMYGGW